MKNITLAISLGMLACAAHSAEKAPLFTVASDVAPLHNSDIGSAKKTGETSAVKLKDSALPGKDKALFQISAAPEAAATAEATAETAGSNPLQGLGANGKAAEGKIAVKKKAAKPAGKPAAKKADDSALQALAAKSQPAADAQQAASSADADAKAAASDKTQAAEQSIARQDTAQPVEDSSESTLFKIASYYEADEMGDSDDAVRKIDFSKPPGQQLPGDSNARSAIADSKAIQRAAPVSSKRSSSKGSYSYVVRGKRYQTLASSDNFVQEGPASWYGPGFHGKKTASGEIYDMHKMTAAHKRLPLGTRLEVTNKRTGKSIIVTVNDRGPFHGNRIIDLSHAAASKLGVLKSGVADVTIRAIK